MRSEKIYFKNGEMHRYWAILLNFGKRELQVVLYRNLKVENTLSDPDKERE